MGLETALLAASVGATAVGGVSSAIQQRGAANFQAKIARNNAIMSERRAKDARERGAARAAEIATRTRQLKGRQRASLAGSNILVDEGSGLDILADTAAIGAVDRATSLRNAELEARGLEFDAGNLRAQGELHEAQGEAAFTSGLLRAGTGILGGGAQVASKWYDSAGVPPDIAGRQTTPLASGSTARTPKPSFLE